MKPDKKVNLLKKKDCVRIIINSRKVLKDAIKKGGSSIKDFKNTFGSKGDFQKNFKVYDRVGLSCKRSSCAGIIKKKIISNRSTFFCDTCQKWEIILLTNINSQVIPLRIWLIQNLQLRE